jgi:hypothetical protein
LPALPVILKPFRGSDTASLGQSMRLPKPRKTRQTGKFHRRKISILLLRPKLLEASEHAGLLAALAAGWLIHSRLRASEPIQSLAVLPLDNLSGDSSQDYFADGMTDELITMLAKDSNLRIVSRTSVMQCT